MNRMLILALLLSIVARIEAAQKDYPVQPVPFTAVKIADGFWSPRFETNRETTVWYDFKRCEDTGRIDNFAKAGRLMQGQFKGIPYDDSDVYKVIEGAAYSLSIQPDPKLDKYLDDLIAKIAAAQEPDGYLYTSRTIDQKSREKFFGPRRWSNLGTSHELYNVGHLYEAAVAHFQATGKKTLLDVATKNADLLCNTFGPGKVQEPPGHQEIEIGLCKLYRATGQQRYLDLAKYYVELRGRADTHKLRGAYQQDHKPITEQDEAVGHSVRAGYFYSGVADVAALTGDKKLVSAIDRLWENVATQKLYLTGGIGARHGGEAFGDNYELPNATAYNETCAAIANALWNQRMFLLHGDAKYVDVLERTIYNGFLSGVGLTGDQFFYPNPLEDSGQYKRSPWFGTACCPVNIVRFIPSIAGYVYATRGDDLYVNLFIGSTGKIQLGKNQIELRQETRYPWNGTVKLTVTPDHSSTFTLKVRIPGWAHNQPVPGDLYRYSDAVKPAVTLAVNGEPSDISLDKGYASIKRRWRRGDIVTLELAMPVRKVVAHDAVQADRDRFAVERGPLVYCAEGADNDGKVLNRIFPGTEVKFETHDRSDLLGGIVTVKMNALTLIPYYAWCNRGANEMSVWFRANEIPVTSIPGRWTAERAKEWYRQQSWPCGFNYVPANAISYTEMWMDYNFDPQLIDKELALAQDIGFNCVRVVLPFVVWEKEPEAFKKRLNAFLSICQKRGLKVMFALFDDCVFGPIKDPVFGKQPDVVPGWYANGWTPSPGHSMVQDVSTWPRLEKYVKDLLTTFGQDHRVWVWDLYNEPTNSEVGDTAIPLVAKVFEWARMTNPAQPLTVGVFGGKQQLDDLVLENSDIITFHNYSPSEQLRSQITNLLKQGRPVICTEWLNRGHNSIVAKSLPVFRENQVGAMHWGLVNGKTQTHLNWGHRPGQPDPKVWQHDIFRPDHAPYDPQEIELFKQYIHRNQKSEKDTQ